MKKLLDKLIMLTNLSLKGIIIQFFLLNSIWAADINAQEVKSVRDVRFDLKVNEASLSELFNEIERKTNFYFSFSSEDLNSSFTYTKNKKNVTVRDVLLEVSERAELKFKQVNRNIIVQKYNGQNNNVPEVEVLIQGITITGKVTSPEDSEGLPGVNVIVKGTSIGTVTDVEGNYTLDVSDENSVLVYSSVGFLSEEILVGNKTIIDLVLTPDLTQLEEIVVTGYASQQKKDLTGAVGIVSAEDLTAMPQGNVTQQLQGRIAGVNVTQDSRPGQAAKIRVRGFGSFQNNDPLYIVDGVPTTDINTINPDDIESLSVLKDAGAASIYGSRASNGVVVITTKKGKSGMSINYNMYYGSQNPGAGPDNMLNTKEFADLQWLVYANDGTIDDHPIYGPSSNASPTLPSWAADTKWYDEVTRNARIMNHDLSLSGGNETSNYYASMGYFDQQGTVIGSWYKRFSVRLNSEFKIKDRVTIGESFIVPIMVYQVMAVKERL